MSLQEVKLNLAEYDRLKEVERKYNRHLSNGVHYYINMGKSHFPPYRDYLVIEESRLVKEIKEANERLTKTNEGLLKALLSQKTAELQFRTDLKRALHIDNISGFECTPDDSLLRLAENSSQKEGIWNRIKHWYNEKIK